MARFSIYSKDGKTIRHSGEPQYSGSYMGVDFVEFRAVSSPYPIDWEIGDYVDYFRTGLRYRLYTIPQPTKVARRGQYGASFEYPTIQLYAATKDLEIAPFRDLVPEDNKIHFSTRPEVSTYEDVYGIARRIQECMNDIFPNRWKIEVYNTNDADFLALLSEAKEYSVSNGTCLDALSQIYETWKNVGWVHTYDSVNDIDVITIGRANVRDANNTTEVFSYGIGNGLTSIKKASANEGEFATRLYVYGSDRNIQTRYYNGFDIVNKDSVDIRNLMLPIERWGKTNGLPDPRKAYLQADDAIIEKYGLIPRTVYFDGSENEEIYPSIKGLTESKVRQAMIDAGQGDSEYLPFDSTNRIDKVYGCEAIYDDGSKDFVEQHRDFQMFIHKTGFDIATQGQMTSEGHATISMLSGKCAGREFKVKKSENNAAMQTLVLERAWDESIGTGFPNKDYQIEAGDEFVLLDIPMPDFYIVLAEDRLLEAGEKMLADYTKVSPFYEPSIDSIAIRSHGKLLRAGMFMAVYDEDIIDTETNTDYVLIDSLTIDEKSELPSYRVTLREEKRSIRNFGALEGMIGDVKESTKQEISKTKKYTDRRFISTEETLDMLSRAFEGFTDSINPATVRTMALLVGDQSNQFKFTKSLTTLDDDNCPLIYDASTKQMKSANMSYIKHMTLGIDAVTSRGAMTEEDYLGWRILEFESPSLEDGEARYVYIQAPKDGSDATFILSKDVRRMDDPESGDYFFLVGILNSEYNNDRDFVTLYGFTEVLPGQITTDKIKSGNNALVIDLVNAVISAKRGATIEGSVKIQDGSLISSRLDVGDTSTDNLNLEAFFNGSEFAKDTSEANCGKLILAAGIPTTEETGIAELEPRASMATTRIYEDGCTYTKNLHLQEGCTIGTLNIDRFGIGINGCNNIGKGSSLNINRDVISVARTYNDNLECTIERSLEIDNRDSADAYITIDENRGDAIRVSRGTFAGLRSRATYRDSLQIGSNGYYLGPYDFNVFFPAAEETYNVYLPDAPDNGQEYWVETAGAHINIMSNTRPIWIHNTGTKSQSLKQTSRGTIRFKFYKDALVYGEIEEFGGIWSATTI